MITRRWQDKESRGQTVPSSVTGTRAHERVEPFHSSNPPPATSWCEAIAAFSCHGNTTFGPATSFSQHSCKPSARRTQNTYRWDRVFKTRGTSWEPRTCEEWEGEQVSTLSCWMQIVRQDFKRESKWLTSSMVHAALSACLWLYFITSTFEMVSIIYNRLMGQWMWHSVHGVSHMQSTLSELPHCSGFMRLNV